MQSSFEKNDYQVQHIEERLVLSGLLTKEVVEDKREDKRREILFGNGEGVFLKGQVKLSSIGRTLLNHGF